MGEKSNHSNGTRWVPKWVFVLCLGAICTAFGGIAAFMGNGIVANDRMYKEEHRTIREDYEAKDKIVKEDMQCHIQRFESEQRIIKEDVKQLNKDTAQILAVLGEIKEDINND